MSDSLSEQRIIENEVVFRNHNESVQKNFAEIKKMAKDADQEFLVKYDDTPLHFYCECSDEDCHKRIQMSPSRYARIHRNRRHFILIGGHQAGKIEKVVSKEADYWIVEKFVRPPEHSRTLQPTGVNNG